ncbi:MLO-like protein 13 isoform X1 [Prosopis cineraria]|uniref:MLO-like protein 13 isoform X1 n=1 Tax=Prosopis cineraria TaxID=364024 RepID=UPI00240F72BF|nr:MLO-like protein 13 isoform X1 [Prosopis cineraria]
MEDIHNESLDYTPTWIVAIICSIIVFISLCVERALHKLGLFLRRKGQDALDAALQKLKDELMLLGFISLLLTVFQGVISQICISPHLVTLMLPCKRHSESKEGAEHYDTIINKRRLLSTTYGSGHCRKDGKVPLLSLESLHHLHIFIFVLAVVHAISCVITLLLGGARIRQWKTWEDKIKAEKETQDRHHHEFFKKHADGFWRRAAVVGWLIAFCKQFYGSVTESDYIAMRHAFIKEHWPNEREFDFHKYMMKTLEIEFRQIVGISWYLWLFVVLFLLLNIAGWHTYFWLAFLPLILLLLVGAKLEHIIARLAQESDQKREEEQQHHQEKEATTKQVKPSDKFFWFNSPRLVLDLIHFILFQNAFEIAFFFWIWFIYGFYSCIMEKIAYVIPRLIMGVIVQVLCSYSTFPLYAIVTQMGSRFKRGMFKEHLEDVLIEWRRRERSKDGEPAASSATNIAV